MRSLTDIKNTICVFFKLHTTGHGKTNFNFTLYRNLSQILWSKRSNENRKNTCKLTWISALVKSWSWQLDAPWGNWNTKNIRNKAFAIGYLLQSIRSRTQVESSSLYFYTNGIFNGISHSVVTIAPKLDSITCVKIAQNCHDIGRSFTVLVTFDPQQEITEKLVRKLHCKNRWIWDRPESPFIL